MNQLQRVQVYLDPKNLTLLDELASGINVGRSVIIRDAVAGVVKRYNQLFSLLKAPKNPKIDLWMDLAGIEESKSGDLGLRVDEIYHERT